MTVPGLNLILMPKYWNRGISLEGFSPVSKLMQFTTIGYE